MTDRTARCLQAVQKGLHELSKSSNSAPGRGPALLSPSPGSPLWHLTVFGANMLLFFTQKERRFPCKWRNHTMELEPKCCASERKKCQDCNQKLLSCWLSFCTNYYAKVPAAYFLLNFCMNKGYSVHIPRSILEKVRLKIFNAVDFQECLIRKSNTNFILKINLLLFDLKLRINTVSDFSLEAQQKLNRYWTNLVWWINPIYCLSLVVVHSLSCY